MQRRPEFLRRASIVFFLAIAGGCATPPPPGSQSPFQVGLEAVAAGEDEKAASQFTLAIDNASHYFFVDALLERGECFLRLAGQAGSPRERAAKLLLAAKDFEAVAQREKIAVTALARALDGLGNVSLAQGELEAAARSFEHILEISNRKPVQAFLLRARHQLGWIHLEEAMALQRRESSAEEELANQDLFRRAQEQFSRGLEIDPAHRGCNLGKGICLYHRRQQREAMLHLERSLSGEGAENDPRGHFYLARALEEAKGYQRRAWGYFREALARDSGRSFLPLYQHLVAVLPDYLSASDAEYREIMEKLLDYQGGELDYWSSVESFADRLSRSTELDRAELGYFGRALARARQGKIEEAVADSPWLRERPDFLLLLERIFPARPVSPAYLFGRAQALLLAERTSELEALFQSDFFNAAGSTPDEHYQQALVIQGRNILQRWRLDQGSPPVVLAPEKKLEKERILGKARDLFQAYLETHDDPEVRMALGEVLERLESFSGAFSSYGWVARDNPNHTEAFRSIQRLHKEKLLPEKVLTEAWKLLRTYAGSDADLHAYVKQTIDAIQIELALYCRSCGRKGTEGETTCLECGQRIGSSPRSTLGIVK
jgi:tetratricopeptide (TPR) repeat protein